MLSSVHAVKGLECVVCFVVGLDTKAWRYLPAAICSPDLQQASLPWTPPLLLSVLSYRYTVCQQRSLKLFLERTEKSAPSDVRMGASVPRSSPRLCLIQTSCIHPRQADNLPISCNFCLTVPCFSGTHAAAAPLLRMAQGTADAPWHNMQHSVVHTLPASLAHRSLLACHMCCVCTLLMTQDFHTQSHTQACSMQLHLCASSGKPALLVTAAGVTQCGICSHDASRACAILEPCGAC